MSLCKMSGLCWRCECVLGKCVWCRLGVAFSCCGHFPDGCRGAGGPMLYNILVVGVRVELFEDIFWFLKTQGSFLGTLHKTFGSWLFPGWIKRRLNPYVQALKCFQLVSAEVRGIFVVLQQANFEPVDDNCVVKCSGLRWKYLMRCHRVAEILLRWWVQRLIGDSSGCVH